MFTFPFTKQAETSDCGPACLKMIAEFYGKNYSLEYLRKKSYITQNGVSLLGISEAAEQIGFNTKGVRINWLQLKNDVPLPCIIHWNSKHFVVVCEIKRKRRFKLNSQTDKAVIVIADPATGIQNLSEEEFKNIWLANSQQSSPVLLFEPTEKFYSAQSNKNVSRLALNEFLTYLKPYRKYLLQFVTGFFITGLIGLAFPFLTQSLVDFGINNSDLNFIAILLIAQLVLTLSQTGNQLIQGWLTLHVTTRVSISFISGFLRHLLGLPLAYFQSRTVGDIMQRISDQSRIQQFLTGTLLNFIFGIIMIVCYSFIMLRYNPFILLVFWLGSVLYIGWVMLFLKSRKKIDYAKFELFSEDRNNIFQLVSGIQEIKLNNAEIKKRWEWERIQARLFDVNVKSLVLSQNQTIGAGLIDQLKNILITFLAARSVVNGEISLGVMLSLQYMIGQINAPITQLIGFFQSAQDAKISLERLDQVYGIEPEQNLDNRSEQSIPTLSDIILKDISFQYEGPNSAFVLKQIQLTFEAGKVTALVGQSGSGKSTLLKLLLGALEPSNGTITIANRSLRDYNIGSWRAKCGIVMQEGFVFSDTIAGNICLAEESIHFERVTRAATIASIDKFISALPQNYSTVIGPGGHGISTGEKQRILIARALYKDADYIFLDEATNSLDSENETLIVKNLKKIFHGKTVIVIAHRLSSIRDADNIVVLDNGAVVEQGCHSNLMAKQGRYYNLVQEQL